MAPLPLGHLVKIKCFRYINRSGKTANSQKKGYSVPSKVAVVSLWKSKKEFYRYVGIPMDLPLKTWISHHATDKRVFFDEPDIIQ